MPWQCPHGKLRQLPWQPMSLAMARHGKPPSTRRGKPHGMPWQKPHGIPWPSAKRNPSFDRSIEGGVRGGHNVRNATHHSLSRSSEGLRFALGASDGACGGLTKFRALWVGWDWGGMRTEWDRVRVGSEGGLRRAKRDRSCT